MRILHTSDWHIGRTFHGVDLLLDQECSLRAIAELVAAERVDVVVLPGDVYDRSIPSADAIAVCNRGFEAIRAAGAAIVATSGNHDSPTRLGALGSFAAAGGLHLRCRIADVARPVLLADEFGEIAFYGIPYLEPEITRVELGVPQARSHAEILDAAMGRVRADLAERSGTRSVVLAHAFVVGGEATGSERSISVGGVETVPLSAFDGIDYVALGHLHSPQTLSESVRYSGSPLPYSFGERSHRKAAWIVDLDGSGLSQVHRHELPVVRGLSQLVGPLDDLLESPDHAAAEADYVSATLTDEARPVDALRRLRERFPHAVHVEWQRPDGNPELRYRERVHGRRDTEIAQSFLADVRGVPTPGEMTWLERALAAATHEKDGPLRVSAQDDLAVQHNPAVQDGGTAGRNTSADADSGVDLPVAERETVADAAEAARVVSAAGFDGSVRGLDSAEADAALGLFDVAEFGLEAGESDDSVGGMTA
ncbi:exonuclease SbcCD subunit D [Nocardia seriolae]|uniref:Nuclease SbcCD subunit D n=1 Tax=Nocardia seriolae TaxID=37332 RepID=A0A0B8N7M0_9NOCA|nr:Nuclease SbcCD subunit [Nocardia seriolae]GEM25919.1 nuclease SbcCD subunit D [Nocardia seriolae NBRC 15557]MTJ65984.1 exonuclease subunit SbcD [Nocardia seriolae]MTJ76145.1 exonuclease subunit SbcD [Nocardia seriolae]MTJ86092.1 exonuclease subunit SbcD [Nocardia seriolae]